MKLSWGWLAPTLLSLLSSKVVLALSSATSVRLVTGITIGLEFGHSSRLQVPQPHHYSFEELSYVHLANHELTLPIMPLHLLGKKSWNVYNHESIARVKRDEAAAQEKEQAEEERMQKIDAQRRLQILRGEQPAPLPVVEKVDDDYDQQKSFEGHGRERKKKRFGENDTEFELRLATKASAVSENSIVLRKQISDAPVTDESGHINLFPQDDPEFHMEKNPEAEAEAARKKREFEDQYTMRFSNAAGFKQGLEKPWYSKPTPPLMTDEVEAPGKNVWGNKDPRRSNRDAARLASSDPLAAMRQGAAKVREVNRERRRLMEDKEKEILDLEKEESSKRKRRIEDDDVEELDLYNSGKSKRHDRHSSKRRHKDPRRSHKHGSPDRGRSRHHHRQ